MAWTWLECLEIARRRFRKFNSEYIASINRDIRRVIQTLHTEAWRTVRFYSKNNLQTIKHSNLIVIACYYCYASIPSNSFIISILLIAPHIYTDVWFCFNFISFIQNLAWHLWARLCWHVAVLSTNVTFQHSKQWTSCKVCYNRISEYIHACFVGSKKTARRESIEFCHKIIWWRWTIYFTMVR